MAIDATKVAANVSLDALQPRVAVEAHPPRLFVSAEDEGDGGQGNNGAPEDGGDEPARLPIIPTEAPLADPANAAAPRHAWLGCAGRADRNTHSGTQRRISTAPTAAGAACGLQSQGTTSPRGRRMGRHRDAAYRERVRATMRRSPLPRRCANDTAGSPPLGRSQSLAWLAAFPLARPGARHRRGPADDGGAEPEAIPGYDRLGAAPLPARSLLALSGPRRSLFPVSR